MSESDKEEEKPQLSSTTTEALLEFYKEQEERERKLKEVAVGEIPCTFDENWNLSQFWYSDETSKKLAKECNQQLRIGDQIAFISCPTLYRSFREINETLTKKLFEYDTRFSVYSKDFIYYDFKSPLQVPNELREQFSVIVADPPYLSDECLTKISLTIKFIAKPNAKIILCTGAIMEDTAKRLLGLKKSQFEIKHEKQLNNPFNCFTNYDFDTIT